MEGLPVEIVLEIVELCPRTDLVSLCLTARYMYAICNPILYNHVDLSIHNRGRITTHTAIQTSSSYLCTHVPANSLSRQEIFIAAILGNPWLAALVKSLTWTLLRLHTKELNQFLLLGNGASGAISRRAILRVWDAFQLLTGVRTLDLAWLSRDHGDPLADSYPNGLFPAATSIRLSGVMHYSFAASILYSNAENLEHLALDNLQQVGKGCDHFLYRRANQRQDYYQSPSTWNQNIHQYGPDIPFGPPGPMQNLLGPLAGRCPNLRSLTLRKVGQRHRNEFPPEFAAKDKDIYHEFATFIDSVKQNLRHFIFEQGERTIRLFRPPRAAAQMTFGGPLRPMDLRFKTILYPHLVEGNWRDLESIEFGGVIARWNSGVYTIHTYRRGFNNTMTRRIKEPMDHIGF